jgi:ligand-binding sensor domain-containing protein
MSKTAPILLCLMVLFSTPGFSGNTATWECFSAEKPVYGFTETDSAYWFATDGGLVELSKNSAKINRYNKANSPIGGTSVTAVYTDRAGNLWTGAQYCESFGGWDVKVVSTRQKNEVWKQYKPISHGSIPMPIRFIAEDQANKLFFFIDSMVYVLNNDSLERTAGPGVYINCVVSDANGRIWAGCKSKLACLQNGIWNEVAFFSGSTVHCMALDGNNKLVVSSSKGCYRLTGETVADTLFRSEITSFVVAADQSIWCVDTVVKTFQNNRFTSDTLKAKKLFKDRAGLVWAVSASDDVYCRENQRWVAHPVDNGDLLSNGVLSSCTASDGTLWIGSDKGIQSLKDGQWRFYSVDGTVPRRPYVNALYEDRNKTMWAVMDNRLLYRAANGAWMDEDITSLSVPAGSNLMGMFHASSGDYWLYSFREAYRKPAGAAWAKVPVKSQDIGGITEDRQGVIWIGGSYFKNDSVIRSDNPYICLTYVHSDGRLWGAGYSLDKLYYRDYYDATWVTTCRALSVRQFLYDSPGAFWLLEGYAVAAKLVSAEGLIIDTLHYQNSPISRSLSCMTRDSSGDVWMGSADGLLKYHPDRMVAVIPGQSGTTGNLPRTPLVSFNRTLRFKPNTAGNTTVQLFTLQGVLLGSKTLLPQKDGWHSLPVEAFSDSRVATGTYLCAIISKTGTTYVPVMVK